MSCKSGLTLLFVTLLTACQSIGSQEDQPAVYVSHTEGSFAELQETVNKIIGVKVGLAANALTGNSTLTIGRTPPSTMQNRNPQGRIVEMPFQFKLMTGSNGCYLVDNSTGRRYSLSEANCRPE